MVLNCLMMSTSDAMFVHFVLDWLPSVFFQADHFQDLKAMTSITFLKKINIRFQYS